jgi:hypothetical protein
MKGVKVMTKWGWFLGTTCLLMASVSTVAFAGSKYRSDVKHRPRLVVDGRDTAHIQRLIRRIERNESPWAGAYKELHRKATKGTTKHHSKTGWSGQDDPYNKLYAQESRNGDVAAAKAMVAWLYSKGMRVSWLPLPKKSGQSTSEGWVKDQAAKSASTIRTMYDDWPCYRGFKCINRGIVAADSLLMHCVAFDFLSALPKNLRPSLSGAETSLSHFAADFRRWHWTVDPQNNNHGIRVISALGVAALTMNRLNRYRWWRSSTWRYRPSKWMKMAVRELHPTGRGSDLRYQLRTGAYAEGSSYYHYAADLYLPFFHSYNRFHRGGGVPFMASDLVNRGARWMVDLQLPDGRRPPVDNSCLLKDTTPGYFLSQVRRGVRNSTDQLAFLWDYQRQNFPGMKGRRGSFLMAAYDPSGARVRTASRLSGPLVAATRILPKQGQAVLRTGWGSKDSYALVVAEQGEVRSHGGGHDSVDQGAYLYYAQGDLITIDPGYFGFSQVQKTNRAEHHSMVLVNGKGPKAAHKWMGFGPWKPSPNDARILSGARTGAGSLVRSVEVESKYRSSTIRRTIAAVENRYLLVEDRCKSWWTKDFTTIVQANAGADKDRPLTISGNTVTYQTNRKKVPVAVGSTATASIRLNTRKREDSVGESPKGHESIEYTARGRKVRFLTAIATAATGAATPKVWSVPVGQGAIALRIELNGRIDIVVSNPDHRKVQVPATRGTSAFTTSDGLSIRMFTGSGVAGKRVWSAP